MNPGPIPVLAIAMLLVACDTGQPDASPTAAPATIPPPLVEAPAVDAAPGASEAATAAAHVDLAPTEGHSVAGELSLARAEGGVRMRGIVHGLDADGVHGFHFHESGDCSAPDATSAGGHFNPDDDPHGRRGVGEYHAGDMDNLRADADGTAQVDLQLEGLELGTGGSHDVVGTAVIVHVQRDDYRSQPTGDAGARAACGVVTGGSP